MLKSQIPLVSPNVKITIEQKEQIIDLGAGSNNRYSDMFRLCLTLGINEFEKLKINNNDVVNE